MIILKKNLKITFLMAMYLKCMTTKSVTIPSTSHLQLRAYYSHVSTYVISYTNIKIFNSFTDNIGKVHIQCLLYKLGKWRPLTSLNINSQIKLHYCRLLICNYGFQLILDD